MANTLLIEGSFEELSEELAVYIDGLSQSSVQTEVAPLLKEGNKVDALKKIVTASSALNSAPEKGVFLPSCPVFDCCSLLLIRSCLSLQNSSLHTTSSCTWYTNPEAPTFSSQNCARMSLPQSPLRQTTELDLL
jgi:hypothetical protein